MESSEIIIENNKLKQMIENFKIRIEENQQD